MPRFPGAAIRGCSVDVPSTVGFNRPCSSVNADNHQDSMQAMYHWELAVAGAMIGECCRMLSRRWVEFPAPLRLSLLFRSLYCLLRSSLGSGPNCWIPTHETTLCWYGWEQRSWMRRNMRTSLWTQWSLVVAGWWTAPEGLSGPV